MSSAVAAAATGAGIQAAGSVGSGIFGAEMNLFIENDGPVTILLEK